MAYTDHITVKILSPIAGSTVNDIWAEAGAYAAAEALIHGRFIIRNNSNGWAMRVAAEMVLEMAHMASILRNEAWCLTVLAPWNWNPSSVRSLLACKRKEWRKEERAKSKEQEVQKIQSQLSG